MCGGKLQGIVVGMVECIYLYETCYLNKKLLIQKFLHVNVAPPGVIGYNITIFVRVI